MVGFDLHNAQVCFPRSVILHFCRSFDLERERGTGERAVAAPGCHVTAGHNIATDVSPGPSCHLAPARLHYRLQPAGSSARPALAALPCFAKL